jgi:putative lipoprotein
VTSSLEATRWVPTRIGSRTLTVRSGTREPYLNLESTSGKVTGFGGCNRFFGGFRRTADSLRFDRIGSTMMTCPPGNFDERELFDVLESTRTWRVLGRELELFDQAGAPIARFEARDL